MCVSRYCKGSKNCAQSPLLYTLLYIVPRILRRAMPKPPLFAKKVHAAVKNVHRAARNRLRAEFLRLETAQNVVDNFWMRVVVEKFIYEFLKIHI